MATTEQTPPTTPEVVITPLEMEERGAGTTRRRLADSQPTTRAGQIKQNIYYMRGRGALEISIVYAVIVVAFILFSLVTSSFPFLNSNNLSGVLSQNIPVLGILAIGAGILMIAGEFDLSLGAVIGLAAVVFIHTANTHGWILAFFAAIATAVAVHLINGCIVVFTRIPSFIATLGMSFFWTGVSIYVNGLEPAVLETSGHHTGVNLFTGNAGYFRAQLVWLIVIGTVAWFLLHRHRLGNKVYAVGGNPAAAKAVSIKPHVVQLQAFAILGFTVGVAAVLIAVRTADMQPGTTNDYTLLAIAAAVVGGCSLTGGRGSIFGMIIGAALILTIENGLILGQAPGFYVQLFLGVSIVIAAVFNKFMEGKAT